jgi:hypothetical protein
MIKSSRSGGCGRLVEGEFVTVAQQGPRHVDQPAGKSQQGLAVNESLSSFAVIELSRGSIGAQAGQRSQVEHPQSAVVAFRGGASCR